MPRHNFVLSDVMEFATSASGLKADTLIADPPYFMQLSKRKVKRYGGDFVEGGIAQAEWDKGWESPDHYQDWLYEWLLALKSNDVVKQNANVIIFMGANSLGELLVAARRAGYYRRTNLHWMKPNSMPNFLGVAPRSDVEYIIVFKVAQKSTAPYYNKSAAKVTSPSTGLQVNMGTVITCNSLSHNSKERTKIDGKTAHQTQKPLELLRILLPIYNPSGGHVIDAFGGTGTTSVVAQELGMDSTYFDVNTTYLDLAKGRMKEHVAD